MRRGRIVSPEYIYGKLILSAMCGIGDLCSLSHSSPENCTLQARQSGLWGPTHLSGYAASVSELC